MAYGISANTADKSSGYAQPSERSRHISWRTAQIILALTIGSHHLIN